MPANMKKSKANKHGSNGGFPGSRGPGMKIAKRRRSKSSQEGQSGAKKHSIAASTNQFLEIENLNSAMRNAHQPNEQCEKSQDQVFGGSGLAVPGLSTYVFGENSTSTAVPEDDFLVDSGRLEPTAPSAPSVAVQPPPVVSTTTALEAEKDATIEVEEDAAYDFIPYDENMLTPNGKHLVYDDEVDEFEPENYEQFQEGEVLTKLPRNIMLDVNAVSGKNMEKDVGELGKIGYVRDVDDLTYTANQASPKGSPHHSSLNSSTGDTSTAATRIPTSASSPDNKIRPDNTLSSPGDAVIAAPKVQDMQNPSPSSSLSTGSDRVAKATVRVDTKNVEGVS